MFYPDSLTETLHSLLQIPVPTNPNDPAPEKSGDALAVLQMTFKGTRILVSLNPLLRPWYL
jgi:hypothetical protein